MTEATEKRDNFIKLAEGRTQLALDAIKKLGNLSNKQAYTWEQGEINQIAKTLRDAISAMERKFDPKSEKKETFKLRIGQ
ncbi:hypothetical protein ACQ3G6_17645 [Allorhizobium undicola]|uniref:hypothetical protein n=1 Tax=Allorhizobium undicola TaxID=78527 RepID=UPI003D3562DA